MVEEREKVIWRNANPVGTVIYHIGKTAPQGYLICDGSAVSRDNYQELFSLMGNDYGAGDGSTTFNLPDLRGEFLRCADLGRGVDPGRQLGSLQDDAIRNITGHAGMYPQSGTRFIGDTGQISGAIDYFKETIRYDVLNGNATSATITNTPIRGFTFDASRQVPTANENRPRNVALLACIKY